MYHRPVERRDAWAPRRRQGISGYYNNTPYREALHETAWTFPAYDTVSPAWLARRDYRFCGQCAYMDGQRVPACGSCCNTRMNRLYNSWGWR